MIIHEDDRTVILLQPVLTISKAAPSKPEPSDLLNLQQADEFLGVTTVKLKGLCLEKRITHSRPDYRNNRFTRADLEKWIDQYRLDCTGGKSSGDRLNTPEQTISGACDGLFVPIHVKRT
jgi:hypothetical protein